MSKIGLGIFFHAGCPEGRPCLKLSLVSFSFSFFLSFFVFFFMVSSNLRINLFIKLCCLLEVIYCSDCLQQKRPNQNLLSAPVSRWRGPSHPYLCDVCSLLEGMFLSTIVTAILFTCFMLNYAVFKKKINPLSKR